MEGAELKEAPRNSRGRRTDRIATAGRPRKSTPRCRRRWCARACRRARAPARRCPTGEQHLLRADPELAGVAHGERVLGRQRTRTRRRRAAPRRRRAARVVLPEDGRRSGRERREEPISNARRLVQGPPSGEKSAQATSRGAKGCWRPLPRRTGRCWPRSPSQPLLICRRRHGQEPEELCRAPRPRWKRQVICILSRKKSLYSTRRLLQAAKEQGHRPVVWTRSMQHRRPGAAPGDPLRHPIALAAQRGHPAHRRLHHGLWPGGGEPVRHDGRAGAQQLRAHRAQPGQAPLPPAPLALRDSGSQ